MLIEGFLFAWLEVLLYNIIEKLNKPLRVVPMDMEYVYERT